MSDGAPFIQAVIDSPDDDAPRLLYADWLEEHGAAERAEFIRLSCKHLRKWKANVHDRNDPDYARMRELEKTHGATWLSEMPVLAGIRWWCFWHGIPALQVKNWNALRLGARRIWEATPVDRVDFNELSLAGGRALAKSPYLKRIRALGLNWVGSEGLPAFQALLASPHLVNLRNLIAFSCGLGDEGAKAIAECPYLTGLEVAMLDSNQIGNKGALAIASSPHLKKLTRLDLSRNPIDEKAQEVVRKRFPR